MAGHFGLDVAILQKRAETYEKAKSKHPGRWSGQIRDWCHKEEVVLNPNKKSESAMSI